MSTIERYAVTLPPPPGEQSAPRVVAVERTRAAGPHGDPVYVDASGDLRVEIAEGGVARLLEGPAGPGSWREQAQSLQAVPLPPGSHR